MQPHHLHVLSAPRFSQRRAGPRIPCRTHPRHRRQQQSAGVPPRTVLCHGKRDPQPLCYRAMALRELGSRKSRPQGILLGRPVPREAPSPAEDPSGASSRAGTSARDAHRRLPAATTAKIGPKPEFWLGGRRSLIQRGAITRVTRVKEKYEERHLVSAQLGCQTSLLLMFLFLNVWLALGAPPSSISAKELPAPAVSPDGPPHPGSQAGKPTMGSSPWDPHHGIPTMPSLAPGPAPCGTSLPLPLASLHLYFPQKQHMVFLLEMKKSYCQ